MLVLEDRSTVSGGSSALAAPAIAMTLDRKRSILWVAQKARLSTFDLEGQPLSDITLKAQGMATIRIARQ